MNKVFIQAQISIRFGDKLAQETDAVRVLRRRKLAHSLGPLSSSSQAGTEGA